MPQTPISLDPLPYSPRMGRRFESVASNQLQHSEALTDSTLPPRSSHFSGRCAATLGPHHIGQHCPTNPASASPVSASPASARLALKPLAAGDCKCIQMIGTLLSDLDLNKTRAGIAPLDSILSYQKSALLQLKVLASCQSCRTRSEFLMLLSVVCEKLTVLCELILTQRMNSPPTYASSQRLARDPSTPSGRIPTIAADGRGENPRKSSDKTQKTFLGEYEISDGNELRLLLRMIFSLHLSGLHGLLSRIKLSVASLPDSAHLSMLLTVTEKRVHNLAKTMILEGGKVDYYSCLESLETV